jgi:hypothetical protein
MSWLFDVLWSFVAGLFGASGDRREPSRRGARRTRR